MKLFLGVLVFFGLANLLVRICSKKDYIEDELLSKAAKKEDRKIRNNVRKLEDLTEKLERLDLDGKFNSAEYQKLQVKAEVTTDRLSQLAKNPLGTVSSSAGSSSARLKGF